MRLPDSVVYFVLFGIVLLVVRGQIQQASSTGQNEDTEIVEVTETEDDEDTVASRLNNVTSIEDFIALMQIDGRTMTPQDVFVGVDTESGKQIIHGGGRMAQPDECSPRDTTVRLNFDNNDPTVVYYPRCTKIERCGGCCSSPHLECVPSYTERVSLQVFKAEVPVHGGAQLTYNGFAPVIVDRHVTCRVRCTLTAEKCGPKKNFLSNQCDCKCKDYQRCQPPLVWDPEQCECSCAEVLKCCHEGQSCGLRFNHATCDCELDLGAQLISNQANLTAEEIEAYYASLNRSDTEAAAATDTATTRSTTTTTTTTATTPTTPAEPTSPDPCSMIACPMNFLKQVTPTGHCVCRPRFRYRSHSARRRLPGH